MERRRTFSESEPSNARALGANQPQMKRRKLVHIDTSDFDPDVHFGPADGADEMDDDVIMHKWTGGTIVEKHGPCEVTLHIYHVAGDTLIPRIVGRSGSPDERRYFYYRALDRMKEEERKRRRRLWGDDSDYDSDDYGASVSTIGWNGDNDLDEQYIERERQSRKEKRGWGKEWINYFTRQEGEEDQAIIQAIRNAKSTVWWHGGPKGPSKSVAMLKLRGYTFARYIVDTSHVAREGWIDLTLAVRRRVPYGDESKWPRVPVKIRMWPQIVYTVCAQRLATMFHGIDTDPDEDGQVDEELEDDGIHGKGATIAEALQSAVPQGFKDSIPLAVGDQLEIIMIWDANSVASYQVEHVDTIDTAMLSSLDPDAPQLPDGILYHADGFTELFYDNGTSDHSYPPDGAEPLAREEEDEEEEEDD